MTVYTRRTPRPTIDRWSLAPNLLAHSIRVALLTQSDTEAMPGWHSDRPMLTVQRRPRVEKAYNEAWAKYDASQRASSNVTGGGMTGETIRMPRRNPGGGNTLLGN